MHDVFKSSKLKPIPKLSQKLKSFDKRSQIISKTPKVRSQIMKCMIKMKKAPHQMKNKDLETENEVRKMKRLSLRCLGEGEILFCLERLGRNGIEITWILFIGKLSFSMD